MRVVVGVLGAVVAVVTAGLVAVYSGVYNVAAGYPHSAFTTWLLHTAMTRSVRRHAKQVAPPPPHLAKNGVRYTGMPAWDPGHDEEALWALVALVQALPSLSPETYRDMAASKQ